MRHHYVPQFLLKAWAETTSDKKIVSFRLDLPQMPSSRLSPKSTACEEDLYSLSQSIVGSVEKQEIETTFLQNLDSNAAQVLVKMHTTGLSSLTHDDLRYWVHFVISLKARTPEAAHIIKSRGSKHLETSLGDKPHEYEAIADTSDPTTLKDWVEEHLPGFIENFGMVSLDKFVLSHDIAQRLLGMTWWLWNFEGQQNHLLLSDRPCIFTAQLDAHDLVIALPIGPWKAFMMTKGERVSDILKSQRHKDLLMRINESSLGQAQKRIYARDESPRRFICNRLQGRLYE